jgi:hypothetical protein
MADKFEPAPTAKHADTPKQRSAADKKADDKLKKGIEGQLPGVRSAEQHSTAENSRRR